MYCLNNKDIIFRLTMIQLKKQKRFLKQNIARYLL